MGYNTVVSGENSSEDSEVHGEFKCSVYTFSPKTMNDVSTFDHIFDVSLYDFQLPS